MCKACVAAKTNVLYAYHRSFENKLPKSELNHNYIQMRYRLFSVAYLDSLIEIKQNLIDFQRDFLMNGRVATESCGM